MDRLLRDDAVQSVAEGARGQAAGRDNFSRRVADNAFHLRAAVTETWLSSNKVARSGGRSRLWGAQGCWQHSSIGRGLREDFPILREQAHGHPLIYFDNAATTQKPRAVIDAFRHYYEHDNANVHRGLHELSARATEAYENARRASPTTSAPRADEIVFTRGTTEGINLVAQSWGGKFIREVT